MELTQEQKSFLKGVLDRLQAVGGDIVREALTSDRCSYTDILTLIDRHIVAAVEIAGDTLLPAVQS